MSPSLQTRFIANILFPVHERLKGHDTVRVRRLLEQSQWWPAERLEAYRVERLRSFRRSAAHDPRPWRRAPDQPAGAHPQGCARHGL